MAEPAKPFTGMERPEALVKIDIITERCKGCRICIEFCPRGVLSADKLGKPVITDLSACTACGICELRCPDFGISVKGSER